MLRHRPSRISSPIAMPVARSAPLVCPIDSNRSMASATGCPAVQGSRRQRLQAGVPVAGQPQQIGGQCRCLVLQRPIADPPGQLVATNRVQPGHQAGDDIVAAGCQAPAQPDQRVDRGRQAASASRARTHRSIEAWSTPRSDTLGGVRKPLRHAGSGRMVRTRESQVLTARMDSWPSSTRPAPTSAGSPGRMSSNVACCRRCGHRSAHPLPAGSAARRPGVRRPS